MNSVEMHAFKTAETLRLNSTGKMPVPLLVHRAGICGWW